MDSVECVVVGAGVIGLAIARALARGGREVILLERGDTIGSETSSRNSEVIHAGIYIVRREAILRRRGAQAAATAPGSPQDS